MKTISSGRPSTITPPAPRQAVPFPPAERSADPTLPIAHPLVLLSIKEVIFRCSLSRSWIYLAMKNGTFPKPYPILSNSTPSRAVRFSSHEIDEWIAQRVRR